MTSAYSGNRRKHPQPTQLGELLKKRREAAHLSQAAFARELGVSRPVLSRLENGMPLKATPEVVASIAAALGLTERDIAYVESGYALPTLGYPEFATYLRLRYPELPEDAVTDLAHFFAYFCAKHKVYQDRDELDSPPEPTPSP
ncbi:MAG TPA: helix-turn-helix transcriptional regulator [Pseudonocardiaceae bacterium]|jgi:transcriptional regulator with XRE-family HTH domain|nr:helix-turn-helix transcriptional regulator [Pseudonocardiaceae bacterium]